MSCQFESKEFDKVILHPGSNSILPILNHLKSLLHIFFMYLTSSSGESDSDVIISTFKGIETFIYKGFFPHVQM